MKKINIVKASLLSFLSLSMLVVGLAADRKELRAESPNYQGLNLPDACTTTPSTGEVFDYVLGYGDIYQNSFTPFTNTADGIIFSNTNLDSSPNAAWRWQWRSCAATDTILKVTFKYDCKFTFNNNEPYTDQWATESTFKTAIQNSKGIYELNSKTVLSGAIETGYYGGTYYAKAGDVAYMYMDSTSDGQVATITGSFETIVDQFNAEAYANQLTTNTTYADVFTGDETYVAGNLLPRVVVDEGSAEATLLFIESTKRLIDYLEGNEKEEAIRLVDEATNKYKENFVKDGKIMANNPRRRLLANLKETRKGVCPYCYSYGYYFLNKYKLYACKNCIDIEKDISNNKQFYLSCVSLMPLYINSDLFTKEELIDIYEEFAKKLISIYNDNKEYKEKITGYEYGLLLYGLVKLNSKYMHDIYKICIQARDTEKIWSEYYIDKKNTGMRWRTWEPGVNIMALEEYWEKIKNDNN